MMAVPGRSLGVIFDFEEVFRGNKTSAIASTASCRQQDAYSSRQSGRQQNVRDLRGAFDMAVVASH